MAKTTGTASLRDLLQDGTLKAGDRLVLNRRSAPRVEAKLEPEGRIKVGNTVYTTPTMAAKKALGVKSVDGWIRWRVPRLGDRTLAEIRSERR